MATLIWTSVARHAIGCRPNRGNPGACNVGHSVLAEPVERLWRETTDRPLRIFSGVDEFTDGVTFYMRSHPLAVRVLDGKATPALQQRIDRDGIALLCPARSSGPEADRCVDAALARARCSPPGKQMEIEVARRYLGVDGKPARYLLITIPPRQTSELPADCA
jgi:hypothetical protein